MRHLRTVLEPLPWRDRDHDEQVKLRYTSFQKRSTFYPELKLLV